MSRLNRRLATCAFSASIAFVCSHSAALAMEPPPSFDAATVLGNQVRGSNYEVLNPVVSDGLVQIFTVKTEYGRITVAGRELLQRRLGELAALAALEQMSQSELFKNALAKSATSPLRIGRDLLRDPFATVEQSVSGVAQAFGRVRAGLSNPGSDPDGVAASALGVSSAKRQLAVELGVDPYTDFLQLSRKLDEVAATVAFGGLAPKAAFSVIGGAAGIALSYSSTAEGVRGLVRDRTPAQLVELNRERLRAMGFSDRTMQNFLESDFYTPADQIRLVEALNSLGRVKNRAVYVDRAATVHSRDLAYFLVRRAEMIASYQRSSGGMITQFVSANGFPVNILADGRALIVAPIDELSWSETPLQAMAAISSGLNSEAKPRPVELRITGNATAAAKSGLQGMGWTILEGYRP